jgi:hypothetical protein
MFSAPAVIVACKGAAVGLTPVAGGEVGSPVGVGVGEAGSVVASTRKVAEADCAVSGDWASI